MVLGAKVPSKHLTDAGKVTSQMDNTFQVFTRKKILWHFEKEHNNRKKTTEVGSKANVDLESSYRYKEHRSICQIDVGNCHFFILMIKLKSKFSAPYKTEVVSKMKTLFFSVVFYYFKMAKYMKV